MTSGISGPATLAYASRGVVSDRSDVDVLRAFAIALGICWSVLFVVVGVRYRLQMYADGSIFSYAIAVRDAWAFHWHNISDRLFVYLFCHLPAETYVELAGDPYGGIVVYGFLFFVAPLLGLTATFAADRSRGRIIFSYACLSTACLCPLVFGFPTETWMAHTLFWPTLAVCHYARSSKGGIALVFATLLALVFTHEGALIFAVAIMATLSFRGLRDAAFLRAAGAFFVVLSIWAVVKAVFPPDPYIADVLHRAALHVFDVTILAGHLVLLLLFTLASYGIAFYVVRRLGPAKATICAASIVALGLGAYWLWFDGTLHTDNRYYLRTVLLIATPVLGVLAAAPVILVFDHSFPVRVGDAAVCAGTAGDRSERGLFLGFLHDRNREPRGRPRCPGGESPTRARPCMLAPLGSHLPWLNGARITLPRHDRTVSQIVGLERRVTRAGKDSIDHGPHGHDDLANAVAGVVNSLCVGGDSWLERWGPALYGRDEWEKLRNDAQARSKAEQQAWESQQLWKHIRENS